MKPHMKKDPLRLLRKRRDSAPTVYIEPGEQRGIISIEGGSVSSIDRNYDWKMWKSNTKDHLSDRVKQANRLLREQGYPILLSCERAIKFIDRSVDFSCAPVRTFAKTRDNYDGADSKSGILHGNNIENLLAEGGFLDYFMRDGASLTSLAPPQAGKTTTNVSALFLAPIIYVMTAAEYIKRPDPRHLPIVYYPILFVPSNRALLDESNEAIDNLFKLYGMVEIASTDRSVITTPNRFLAEKYQVHKALSGPIGIAVKAMEDSVLERGEEEIARSLTVLTSHRPTKAEMSRVANYLRSILSNHGKQVQDVQREFVIINDEYDHGEQDGQLMDDLLHEETLFYRGQERSIMSICRNREFESRIINSSATPFSSQDSNVDAETIRLRLGEGYHGFNFFGGALIDDRVTDNTEPDQTSMSAFADAVGVPFLRLVRHNMYRSKKFAVQSAALLKELGRTPLYDTKMTKQLGRLASMNGAQYDVECEKALAKMIDWLSQWHHDIVIRFTNDKKRTGLMIEAIQKILGDKVDIGQWNGDSPKKTEKSAAMYFTKHHKDSGGKKPVVQFVVAFARRGNPYPAAARFFIEFTKKAASMAVIMQGLLGRACGYGAKYDETLVHPITGEMGFGNLVVLSDIDYDTSMQSKAQHGHYDATPRRLSSVSVGSRRLAHSTRNLTTDVVLHRGLSPQIKKTIDRLQPTICGLIVEDEAGASGTKNQKTGVKTTFPNRKVKHTKDNYDRLVKKGTVLLDGKGQNRRAFVEMWRDSENLTKHIESRELSELLMGVESLKLYDWRNANEMGITCDAHATPERASSAQRDSLKNKRTRCKACAERKERSTKAYWLHPDNPRFAHPTIHWAHGTYDERLRNLKESFQRTITKDRGDLSSYGRTGERPEDAIEIQFNVVRGPKGESYHPDHVRKTSFHASSVDEFRKGDTWWLESIVLKCEKPTHAERILERVGEVTNDKGTFVNGLRKGAKAGAE
jgi:hypothetical protein